MGIILSNANETPSEAIDVTASPLDGTAALTPDLENAVKESRARLADELESKPKRGRPRGSGRKRADDASSPKPVEGEVLPKAVNIPSMVPAFTKGVVSISERLALRRDYPGYKLTDEQAAPIADCLDKVLLRYAPGMSSEHPELVALITTVAITFGPIVLGDLAEQDRRRRAAMQEQARQEDLNFKNYRGARASDQPPEYPA